jgi:hypothetical protein
MNSIRTYIVSLFTVVAFSVACSSKPNAPANASGNSNRFFTAVSRQEIKAVNGARFEEVVGPDGHVSGIKVVALDDEQGPTLPCVCGPGCGGNCKTTGFGSSATCSGSCSTSEERGCGSCYFELPNGQPVDGSDPRSTTTDINSNKMPVVKP